MKKIIAIFCLFFLFVGTTSAFIDEANDIVRGKLFPNEYNYNKGVENYEKSEYLTSIEYFLNVDCDGKYTDLCFKNYHNLGNALYYFSFEVADDVKVGNYEKAIEFYKRALEIKEDTETRKNKEFVEDKLKKLKEKLEQPNYPMEQPNGGKGDQKNNDKGQNPQSGENNDNSNSDPQNNNSQGNAVEPMPDYVEKDKIGQKLTEQEKKDMEGYLDYLKSDAIKNSRNYGNEKKQDTLSDILDKQFGDPFGFGGMGGHGQTDKDW